MITQTLKSLPSKNCCFVYGTLMSQEVQHALIGRVPNRISKAYLSGNYSRHPVLGQVYPGVIRKDYTASTADAVTVAELEDNGVSGTILMDLDDHEMKIFDWFEDVEYERQIVPIYSIGEEDGKVNVLDTNVYIWVAGESQLDLTMTWDYEKFRSTQLEWYLEHTVIPCRQEINKLGLNAL